MGKNIKQTVPCIAMDTRSVAARFRQIEQGEEAFALSRVQSLRSDISQSNLPESDRDQHMLSLAVMEHGILGRRTWQMAQKAQQTSDQESKMFFLALATQTFQDYLDFCQNNPAIVEALRQEHADFMKQGQQIHDLCNSRVTSPAATSDSSTAQDTSTPAE